MDARNLLSLSGVLLVLGAAGYYWGIAQRAPDAMTEAGERRPDYVAQALSSTETDDQGRLLRRATATGLRHYEGDPDRAELDEPVITFYQRGQEAWQLSAPRATSLRQNSEIKLEGGVTARRRDPELPVTLHTQTLTAWPREERLATPDAVAVESPRGRLDSVGLEASLPRGELKLNRNVSATYAPLPR